MFLGFANFYRQFIQGFSKIAGPLTSMLRTSPNNSSEDSLTSEDVAKEDEVVLLPKSKKPKMTND